jgi:hypothetical protein
MRSIVLRCERNYMADESSKLTLFQSDFPVLVGSISENKELFETGLTGLGLATPVNETRIAQGGASLIVEWATFASEADRDAVIAFALTFTGGTTSEAPIVATNAGPVTAPNATPVTVIDVTSPPLAAGTYQVVVSCQMRMQAEVVGDAARAILTLTTPPASAPAQQEHWGFAVSHAYNAVATFNRQAGQTIQVLLQVAEVGPGSGVAEITNARVTIDKIS